MFQINNVLNIAIKFKINLKNKTFMINDYK